VGKSEGKRPMGRPRRRWEDNTVLRWIFRKLEEVVGTGWSWLRIGTVDYSKELSVSIKTWGIS
jgi:hypothetical protein